MPALNTDKLLQVGKPGTATTLSSPGHTSGGTSITVSSTTNWPTATAVAFAIDRAELVGGEEVQIPGTYTEWIGVVTGATTIGSMVISGDSPNSDQNYSAGSLTRVYIPVSATRENKIVEWGLVHADQDGTLKAGSVDGTTILADNIITPAKLTDELQNGWVVGELPAVSSVTNNGNGSEDITFASSVASILSPGMRIRTTRTVAAPTYMGGAFNGSSHYFTKTSPSGTLGTVTNNFTIRATIEPTAYQSAVICGRSDSTPNNALVLIMEASGQISVMVRNGATANYRNIMTYQSVPLNKKTRITATWSSGTVVIYLNGISVPVSTATTGGTAPTTAGTGGDWSIGRNGAYAGVYFTGYISEVSIFDAVLSASTIKQYDTYSLTGSETNCIGAWSLNNTANDQSSAGNNLTATGGVGYTSGKAPYATDGNGVSGGTYDYGLVMAVSGSTATVQFPEGCSAPTSGGISAVAYSTQANPFGFPSDKGRWEVAFINKATLTTKTSPTVSTWYNLVNLTIPKGLWTVKNRHYLDITGGGLTYMSTAFTLSTSSSAETHPQFTARGAMVSPAAAESASQAMSEANINLSSATVFYLNQQSTIASATAITMFGSAPSGDGITVAIPSGL